MGACSLGGEGTTDSVEQVDFEPHSAHDPVQPTTLSVLQRGHRIASDSNPQLGQIRITPIYNTPMSRATRPPTPNAMATEPAKSPTK